MGQLILLLKFFWQTTTKFFVKANLLFVTPLCTFLACNLLLGCNSLFFHPESEQFYSPTQVGLEYREVKIKSSDEISLSAWIIESSVKESKGTIIQFHGNAENMSTHFLSLYWLVHEGFRLVTFDYRGYGKSEGQPSRAGLIQDGMAVLSYVAKNVVKLGEPIFIIGQSLGGGVAVVSAANSPTVPIRAMVLDSVFANYQDVAKKILASLVVTAPLSWLGGILISSGFDPEGDINRLSMPILFIHSLYDPVVPFEEGIRLFKVYEGPKDILTLKEASHIAFFSKHDIPSKEFLLKFLQ